MAREVVAWCDVCMSENEHTRGRTVSIQLDAAIPAGLDLCETHESEHLSMLRALISKYGQPIEPMSGRTKPGPRRPDDAPPPVRCPMCAGTRSTLQSMISHLQKEHDVRVDPNEGSPSLAYFGTDCPLCGQGPFDKMGMHVTLSHPEVQQGGGIAGAFALAFDKGDPHGVIRKHEARVRNAKGGVLSAQDT